MEFKSKEAKKHKYAPHLKTVQLHIENNGSMFFLVEDKEVTNKKYQSKVGP
jgi:hypothetical protein